MQPAKSMKAFLSVMAMLGWFALIIQFRLMLNSRLAPEGELIIRYFSYFTILTNLMVAICCTTLFLLPATALGTFFSRPTVLTAIAVYILIVGIIYNLVLRFLWNPEGLQRLVDELLHSAIPILFGIYWVVFVEKDQLQWNSVWRWLLYPVVYIIYIFFRGASSGFYPYPFIDVSQLGMEKALINSGIIALAFLLISLIFIGIAKRVKKGKDVPGIRQQP